MNSLSQGKGSYRRSAGWLGWTLAGLCWLGCGDFAPAHAQDPKPPPGAPEVWVTNHANNTLWALDENLNQVAVMLLPGDQLPAGSGSLVRLADGTQVSVLHFAGTVSFYDTAKHAQVGAVTVRGRVDFKAASMAASPDSSRVYVQSFDFDAKSAYFTVIDTSRHLVVKEVSLGDTFKDMRYSNSMTVSPDGTRIHVLMSDSRGNGKLVAFSPTGDVMGSTDVEEAASAVAVSSDGQYIFKTVPVKTSEGTPLTRLSMLNALTYAPVRDTTLELSSPSRMKVSPNGKHLYLADAAGQSLWDVDVDSLKATRFAKLPGAPDDLAVSGDGSRIWVTVSSGAPNPVATLVMVDAAAMVVMGSKRLQGDHESVALKPGWRSANFGTGNGSVDVDPNGVWNLRGNGTVALGGNSDNISLVYQDTLPPGLLSARVLKVQGGDLGLQVRRDASPDAANVFVRVFPSGVELKLGETSRTEKGGETGFSGSSGEAPLESKPEVGIQINDKENATFISLSGGEVSDRKLWTVAGDPVDPPQGPVLMGIALASATPGGIVTAQIDQVRVQPGVLLPYGMKAVGSDRAVTLTWRPLPGGVRYHVYRGPHGGALKDFVLQQVVAGTSYRDTSSDLKNGTTYDYAVAVEKPRPDGTPGEGDLVAIPGTPVSVPSGMSGWSIAEGTNSGSVAFDPQRDIYSLRGFGYGIGWNGDQCYFAGKAVEGNTQVYATLLGGPTVENGFTAGLMLRSTLFAGSPYMGIEVHATSGLVATWRSSTDGPTVGRVLIPLEQITYPIQLAIARVGDNLWYGEAPNGKSFRWEGSVPLKLLGPIYAGMAITSNNRQKTAEAQFSRFGTQ